MVTLTVTLTVTLARFLVLRSQHRAFSRKRETTRMIAVRRKPQWLYLRKKIDHFVCITFDLGFILHAHYFTLCMTLFRENGMGIFDDIGLDFGF